MPAGTYPGIQPTTTHKAGDSLTVTEGQPTSKIRRIFADSKYHSFTLYEWVEGHANWKHSIIRRPEGQRGWVRLPIRWTVERTFAWLGMCRGLSKDRERTVQSSEAFVRLGMIHLMLNRLKPKTQEPEFLHRMAAQTDLWDRLSVQVCWFMRQIRKWYPDGKAWIALDQDPAHPRKSRETRRPMRELGLHWISLPRPVPMTIPSRRLTATLNETSSIPATTLISKQLSDESVPVCGDGTVEALGGSRSTTSPILTRFG
jgi:transposase